MRKKIDFNNGKSIMENLIEQQKLEPNYRVIETTKIQVSIKTQEFRKTFEEVIKKYSIEVERKWDGGLYNFETKQHYEVLNFSIDESEWRKIKHLFDDDFKMYYRNKKIDKILRKPRLKKVGNK